MNQNESNIDCVWKLSSFCLFCLVFATSIEIPSKFNELLFIIRYTLLLKYFYNSISFHYIAFLLLYSQNIRQIRGEHYTETNTPKTKKIHTKLTIFHNKFMLSKQNDQLQLQLQLNLFFKKVCVCGLKIWVFQ